MEQNDLKSGKVYFWIFSTFCSWIAMCSEDGGEKVLEHICFNSERGAEDYFTSYGTNFSSQSSFTDGTLKKGSLREATWEEQQWLELSKQKGKLIDRNSIPKTSQYEIY